jgi:hypothetical protein
MLRQAADLKLAVVRKLFSLNGGQGRNRTADASLFRAWLLNVFNDLERTDDTVSH